MYGNIINNILTPGIMTRSMSSHDSPSCGVVSGTREHMYPGETFGKTRAERSKKSSKFMQTQNAHMVKFTSNLYDDGWRVVIV